MKYYEIDLSKTVAENWVSKQSFFCFDIDYCLNHIFYESNFFCFLQDKKLIFSKIICETSQAVVSKYAKIDPKDGACCPNFQ